MCIRDRYKAIRKKDIKVNGKRCEISTRLQEGDVLTVIPEGASVTVLEKTTSEWYKVSYGSRTGYVFTEYLK